MNFGRFLPQAAYALSAYAQLVEQRVIALGDEVRDVSCVDVLMCVSRSTSAIRQAISATYWAASARDAWACRCDALCAPATTTTCWLASCGVVHLWCNGDDVCVHSTGTYDISQRAFAKTISPSMDILKSSNLVRV
jgi:hypothetical protein